MREGRRAELLAAVLVVLASGTLSACAGGERGASDESASPKKTVAFLEDSYSPSRVRVPAGSRVTFVNRSSMNNTAETDGVDFFEFDREKLDRQNLFDIHVLSWGEAESVELDTPGVYRYHSSLNSQMEGVIEVVAPE